jgi:hypothetical protein
VGERCPDVELFDGERLIAGALCGAGAAAGVVSCIELLNTIMSFGFGGATCGATIALEPLPYFGAGAEGAAEAQPMTANEERVSPTRMSLACAELKVMPLHTSNEREVFPFHWKSSPGHWK